MGTRVSVLFTLLALICASSNLQAACPTGQQKARVIFVNGILTGQSDAQNQLGDIKDRFTAYAIAKGLARDTDCVDFALSYNDTRGFWHDLLVDARLESLDQSISKFLTWAEAESATESAKNSVSTAISFLTIVSKPVYDTELNKLVQSIQDAWTAKRTAVIFAHSEGNFYANYVYQYFKNQGIKLPDPQKLVIVSLASPAGKIEDGRNMYVKTCTDIIRSVFGSLTYNYNEPNGCSIQFPIVNSDNIVADIYNWFSNILTLNPSKIPGDHLVGHYIEANSALNGRVMQLLNSSLPDGNCPSITCFWNSPSINSWEWDSSTTNKGASPVFTGGKVNMTVESILPVPGTSLVSTTAQVKSLRQFSDNFSLQVKFLHGGMGASEIRLERATDNLTAAGFRIYPLGGLVYASVFNASTNQVLTTTPNIINKEAALTFTATAGKVKISLADSSGNLQLGELPWDNSGSYRLVAESLIEMSAQVQRNVLYLNSVVVNSSDLLPPPPPPPTLVPSCFANPAIIMAGLSTVFTGSSSGGTGAKTGIWGGVVSGSGSTATYTTSVSAPAGFAKATYTVSDSGSPKQLATANCQVQINTPVVSTGFNETFDSQYATRWIYTATAGSPIVTWTAGDLKVRAPKSGSAANFKSIPTFSGDVDASFTFNHQGYGRTSVAIVSASGGQQLAGADLDTNDTAYLNFSSGSQSTQYKYNSSPYMNRKLVIRIAISGSQVRFYADGALMETMPFSGTGPYRLLFAVGSVSWKSGDNITDFYGITATTGTAATPTTGTVNINATKDGAAYTGSLSCTLTTPSGQRAISNFPASQGNQQAGPYSLSCVAPTNTTLTGITPFSAQTLSAGGSVSFTVGLKTTVVVPPPFANASCSVSTTSAQTGQQVTYTANWTGGSGSPGFNWSGYISGTSRTVNWTFNSPGTYTASVLIMDNGKQLVATCPSVLVVSSGPSAPTVSGYFWNNTPRNNVLFSGNISGTGFVSGNSAVYFCVNNTATCYQHPAVGVAVNSSSSLSVYNVKLTTGYWQAKIVTAYGTALGPTFFVQ